MLMKVILAICLILISIDLQSQSLSIFELKVFFFQKIVKMIMGIKRLYMSLDYNSIKSMKNA